MRILHSFPRRSIGQAQTRGSRVQRNQGTSPPQLRACNIVSGSYGAQERDAWASVCEPGGKYYLTRNASTISAFAIGKKWKVGGTRSTAIERASTNR